MPVFVEALAADLKEKAEETQLKKLDALQAQISRDFDALSTDLETPGKMSWLNQDSNYKKSICEVIEFKLVRMSKLVRELSAFEEGYLEDPLTTGLHVAAREGRTKTVAALLSFGADADAKDKAGRRALELAKDDATFEALKAGGATMSDMTQQKKNDLLIEYVKKGLAGGALMALQAGADVNHKDEAGNTAVELAQNAQTIDVLKGAGATMPEFPEEKKNDLLIEYAKKGATGGALMALQAGADVNHKDKYERTALHWAAKEGHEALAQGLLGAGADINAADAAGWTPLHWAAVCNKPEVAKVLLANGAQVNAGNNAGRTALANARTRGHREMEALLLQHGAE
jgi:hypothetical protein